MDDTDKHSDKVIKETVMSFSGEKRLLLAAKSHEAARDLVRASLSKDLTDEEIRRELFLRFYKNDFSSDEIRMIIEKLKTNIESA
jgi:hypothetical protein